MMLGCFSRHGEFPMSRALFQRQTLKHVVKIQATSPFLVSAHFNLPNNLVCVQLLQLPQCKWRNLGYKLQINPVLGFTPIQQQVRAEFPGF